ncbi:MAG: hypothetical protein ACOYU2_00095, partial [Nitrospirota bacterium]
TCGCQAMVWSWSDLDSPSVAWMPKRAVFASENGWMPFENEAERLYHCLTLQVQRTVAKT